MSEETEKPQQVVRTSFVVVVPREDLSDELEAQWARGFELVAALARHDTGLRELYFKPRLDLALRGLLMTTPLAVSVQHPVVNNVTTVEAPAEKLDDLEARVENLEGIINP